MLAFTIKCGFMIEPYTARNSIYILRCIDLQTFKQHEWK